MPAHGASVAAAQARNLADNADEGKSLCGGRGVRAARCIRCADARRMRWAKGRCARCPLDSHPFRRCRGAEISASTVDQLFEKLDANKDGKVTAEELGALDTNQDGRIDLCDIVKHEADYISIKKLQKELAFREEKKGACKAGVMFVLFNIIGYQIVVDSHVR